MYSWCAYCQHLIGEVEPLTDYRVSHGMCKPCSIDIEHYSPAPSVLRAKALFTTLYDAAHSGQFEACDRAIDEALRAGLRPSEIMIGVLHPALGQIGARWETGEISVAEEHRFTEFANRVIQRLRHQRPSNEWPLVLLAPFEENYHEVGLCIMEHLAWERDVPCSRLPVGTSVSAITTHVVDFEPNLVGLSVSLVEMVPAALEFARTLATRLPTNSELILGGQAFRHGEAPSLPDDLTVLRTIDSYIERIERLRNPRNGSADTH